MERILCLSFAVRSLVIKRELRCFATCAKTKKFLGKFNLFRRKRNAKETFSFTADILYGAVISARKRVGKYDKKGD